MKFCIIFVVNTQASIFYRNQSSFDGIEDWLIILAAFNFAWNFELLYGEIF